MTRHNTLMVGGCLLAFTLPASALDVELSGQVNRALMYADDGENSELYNVDNTNSSTRFRIRGTQELTESLTAGARFEVEFQSNPSNDVSPTEKNVDAEFGERYMEVFLSGDFGTVYLGQGDGAANGNMERDLSGTGVISWRNPTLLGGSIQFHEDGVAGPSISSTMSNLDFESRYDRVRYSTPELGPVTLAVSAGSKGDESDVYEVGARLDTRAIGGRLIAAAGYSVEQKPTIAGDEETMGGSVSWLADSGFNVSAAYSVQEDEDPSNPESDFAYLKLGYRAGVHAFDIHYGVANDRQLLGDESTVYGVGYVWTPVKWANLYAGAKIHSLDRDGANYDDIPIVTVGTRLKF
jgi:predicted porin